MLNLASFLLGASSWILALVAIEKKGSYSHSVGSFALCGSALAVQFFEIQRRVEGSDWAGLMDTVPTLVKTALFLLAVTVFLNVLALGKSRQ